MFLNKFYIIIHLYCVWFIVQNSWYKDLNTHCILHALSILSIIIASPTLLPPIFRTTTTHKQFIVRCHKLIMNRIRSRTGSPVLAQRHLHLHLKDVGLSPSYIWLACCGCCPCSLMNVIEPEPTTSHSGEILCSRYISFCSLTFKITIPHQTVTVL